MQRVINFFNSYFNRDSQLEELVAAPANSEIEIQSLIIKIEETPAEEKPISTKILLKEYLTFIFSRENYFGIFIAAALTVFGTGLNFLAPYLLGAMIRSLNETDKEQSQLNTETVTQLFGLLMVYHLSQLVPNYRNAALIPIAAHNTAKLLSRITEHQLNKSLDYQINTPESAQVYMIQMGYSVSNIGAPLLTSVAPTALEVSIAIILLSVKYGATMGCGLLGLMIFYISYCAKTTKPIIESKGAMLKAGGEAWKAVTTPFSQYKTIHDFNHLSFIMRKVRAVVHNAAEVEVKSGMTPLKIARGQIAIPRIGMFMALLYLGKLPLPEFIALFGYLNQLCFSLPAVGQAINNIFSSYPDLEFVFKELAKPSQIADPHSLPEIVLNKTACIEFENVSFGYPGQPMLFNNLSFKINAGETVAFVSESGCGKSTIFNLLYRYYTPSSGRIYINNQDISSCSRKSLQRKMGLVEQNSKLFGGTVRDNIKFGAKDPDTVTDQHLFQLAGKLNLVKFICALPESKNATTSTFKMGLDREVGEGGKALSGGQQQKLVILRGFLKDTPVYLLDEVTSALDAESKSLVLNGMKTITAGKTTLVISHNLSETTTADNIFVLDQGSIIAQGKHADLLIGCQLYKKLWMKQDQSKREEKEYSTASVVPNSIFAEHQRTEQAQVKSDIDCGVGLFCS